MEFQILLMIILFRTERFSFLDGDGTPYPFNSFYLSQGKIYEIPNPFDSFSLLCVMI